MSTGNYMQEKQFLYWHNCKYWASFAHIFSICNSLWLYLLERLEIESSNPRTIFHHTSPGSDHPMHWSTLLGLTHHILDGLWGPTKDVSGLTPYLIWARVWSVLHIALGHVATALNTCCHYALQTLKDSSVNRIRSRNIPKPALHWK